MADLTLWNHIVYLIGQLTVILLLSTIVIAVLLVTLSLYSFRTGGKILFPRFTKSGLILLEGHVKAVYRFLGIEDREVLAIFISIGNTINRKTFEKIPVSERAIFLPQCLRSARCPANLSPEGIRCRNCGLCTVGANKAWLEGLGYRVFIVPGSSFIKRMVRKYHPLAIVGIGCLAEVKEGLEMGEKIGLVSMGVVTAKEGCVETVVDWYDVAEVALLGIAAGSYTPPPSSNGVTIPVEEPDHFPPVEGP